MVLQRVADDHPTPSNPPPPVLALAREKTVSRKEKSIHHHRGNPAFFSGSEASPLSGPMVYTLFLCFPRKMVYTIVFLLCDLGVGRQTEKGGVYSLLPWYPLGGGWLINQHQPNSNNYNSSGHQMQYLYSANVVSLLSTGDEKVF